MTPIKIAIYSRPNTPINSEFLDHFLQTLLIHKIFPCVYEPFYSVTKQSFKIFQNITTFNSSDDLPQVDFLFSLGGDGTLLDTLSLVRDSGLSVMAINTGRLGFLSSISKEQSDFAIECLTKGHFSIDKRTLLRLETNSNLFGDVNYALNELTIHKKETSAMIRINAYLNGEFLNTYWADGLIISTPTGSTGYSLSCGGPIIVPTCENFVITPIAPHNMNVRPIIVSDKNIISLELEGRSQFFMATLDSRSATIDSSVQLAVRKETFCLHLVRISNANFLDTIRNKLMWGMDSRN